MTDRSPVLLSVLRLCRIGAWFSPAADVLAGAAVTQIPFNSEVAWAMLASVALYGAGMVWNDFADLKEDQRQRPERPLASGALPRWFAAFLGLALLAGGLAASPCRQHHGLIAVLILFYDFLGKRLEWLGAINMGLLRALNLSTGLFLITAERGLPDEARRALLIAALCYGIYIVAVTVIGIFEDTPAVSARAVATMQAAPPIIGFAGIAAVQGSMWPAPTIAALPALWFLRRNARISEWPQAAVRQSMLYLLLGTMLYTSLLSLAAGSWPAALGIAATIPAARLIARKIALS